MMRGLKDGEHLVRVVLLFVAGVVLFVLAQRLLVPPGFGALGHYRPGALADNRAFPVVYAGRAACEECHTDVADARKGGRHERIGCEACHGPLAGHAQDASAKPARPDGRELCLRCHAQLQGRPATFPQVQAKEHAPEGACIDCHTAHKPDLEKEGAK
jgi:predicted CXXCH cytochrome family protein